MVTAIRECGLAAEWVAWPRAEPWPIDPDLLEPLCQGHAHVRAGTVENAVDCLPAYSYVVQLAEG